MSPKEHQQHLELAAFQSKVAAAYTLMVTISTDEHHTLRRDERDPSGLGSERAGLPGGLERRRLAAFPRLGPAVSGDRIEVTAPRRLGKRTESRSWS